MRNTFGIISIVLVFCVVTGIFLGCGGEEKVTMIVSKFNRCGYDSNGKPLPDEKEVPRQDDDEKPWIEDGKLKWGTFIHKIEKEQWVEVEDKDELVFAIPEGVDPELFFRFFPWQDDKSPMIPGQTPKNSIPKHENPDEWDKKVEPVNPIILEETFDVFEVDGQLYSIWKDELGQIRKMLPASEKAKEWYKNRPSIKMLESFGIKSLDIDKDTE